MLLRLLSSITYRMVEKTKAIIMQEDISDVANGTYLVEVFRGRVVSAVVPRLEKSLGFDSRQRQFYYNKNLLWFIIGALEKTWEGRK